MANFEITESGNKAFSKLIKVYEAAMEYSKKAKKTLRMSLTLTKNQATGRIIGHGVAVNYGFNLANHAEMDAVINSLNPVKKEVVKQNDIPDPVKIAMKEEKTLTLREQVNILAETKGIKAPGPNSSENTLQKFIDKYEMPV